jgi:beta-lactamase regulating signal transducer with metallopeptidase domain
MIWQQLFDPGNSSRICFTLLHSLWQVALAAILAGIATRLWRKSSVEWNYIIHFAALVVSLVAVPITFMLLSPELPPSLQADALQTISNGTPANVDPRTNSPIPQSPYSPDTPRESGQSVHGADAVAQFQPVESKSDTEQQSPWLRMAPWLAGVYAVGVAAMLMRLVVGVARAERLRRFAIVLQDGRAARALRRLAQQWSLRTAPALAQSERIVVPTVVGLVKPMILLPATALSGLTTYELELILAHELAHIRRFDIWVNVLQRLAEVVLFFNPALWYLNRRIAAYREYCCDELACREREANASNVRTDYASALVRVVELTHPLAARNRNVIALASSGNSPSELRRRIARLVGEPVNEPLRISRGGLLAAALALLILAGPVWLRSEAQTSSNSTSTPANQYPPPPTKDDETVAAARARTFGLQALPRISLRQTYWGADVLSMKKVPESSLKMLWKARGQAVDEKERGTNAVTVAWDGPRLLIQTESNVSDDAASPIELYTQSYYWDGDSGWLGETSPRSRNIYRYATMDKLFEHVGMFAYPHWDAAGGRLPWNGPTVVLEEHGVDPKLTRYQRTGTERIDDVECDMYDGPGRNERVWIERATGLIKATSGYFVHKSLPNYETEMTRELTGRTFANARDYWKWVKEETKDVQDKLGAHWAAAHWKLATPAHLTVFSDYREIAPGVRWPMKCEHTVVLPRGNSEKAGYRYLRAEGTFTDIIREFSIRDLAKAALPQQDDSITDRRFDPDISYAWKDSLPDRQLQAIYQAKLQKQHQEQDEERRINETPINSVADAMRILTDGPSTDPAKVWARAIKYLVDHKDESLPALIKQLDLEQRDHPISKIAFTLRAIGDRRAVPALIRALPRTLLPSRSDFGLVLDDSELSAFMQQHDQKGKVRGASDYFDYGRAFREVICALHRLTGQDFDDMELNWVHLSEAPAQQAQQRAQFHQLAQRWVEWWQANWKSMVDDAAYAKVNLPPLAPAAASFAGRQKPPSGAGVKLQDGPQGWIVESAHEATRKRCFVDLDTMREGGWPASLPPIEKIGVESPTLLIWARKNGYDMVGITYTSPGSDKPLYCLKPLDMHVWKIGPQEHRDLDYAMAGRRPYPLSHPVDLLIPQQEMKPPYDRKYGGDAFLFITREGTAGIIRMTAQVTDPTDSTGAAYSDDEQFSPTGFYRGAKISFAAMTEADAPPEPSSP